MEERDAIKIEPRIFIRLAKTVSKYYLAKLQSSPFRYKQYVPGEPLRICMWGTSGLWNTGADARTHEIIRQTNHILGPNILDIRLAVLDKVSFRKSALERYRHTADLPPVHEVDEHYFKRATYFRPRRLTLMSALLSNIDQTHGFMVVDGGLFMSGTDFNFTLPLTLGMHRAAKQKKFSLAYGVDADESPWPLDHIYSRIINDHTSTIITRTPYNGVLKRLGLNVRTGTDTAWTFTPLPPFFGKTALSKNGWDQKKKILAICPNHRYTIQKNGIRTKKNITIYDKNIVKSFANAIKAFNQYNPVFPIVISMSRQDILFSRILADSLGGVPHFASGDYDMFQLISILRCADFIISSRYHAIVLSMPAGIPSGWIGPTEDPRLKEIFEDHGHSELVAYTRNSQFEQELLSLLQKLRFESEQISTDIQKSVVKHFHRMSDMGKELKEVVLDCYPEFEILDDKKSWYDFLPPLDSNLMNLLEQHS